MTDREQTRRDAENQVVTLLIEERDRLKAELEQAERDCPFCKHEWKRHDPEDGRCDAHTGTPGRFDVCECGRDIAWMQKRIAALSSEALDG